MLSNLGAEVRDANLVEPKKHDQGNVEWFILVDDHDCKSQWVIEKDRGGIQGGLHLEGLCRCEEAA